MKDLVLQLRYLGVIPKNDYREYGFRIEDKDKNVRQIVLTIDNGFFVEHHLMFQEAPDLCYQKMLTDLGNETPETPLCGRVPVTVVDIANYRDSHPAAKGRSRQGTRNSARRAEAS
ncbi:MAG TPA: hypothetical protein VE398_22620 [Acidobacteriota bacterium]|nr:hypothetical protein [Acidobacteriota bacterium]